MVSTSNANENRIVIFPNPHYKSLNPYLKDLCQSTNAINKDELYDANIVNLLKHLFDGNIYIFNWPENLIFRKFGYFQIILFLFCLVVLKIRRVKLVWIFHNISPHHGHTWATKEVYKVLFHWSNLIITHSQKALRYIREHTKVNSVFIPHPFRRRFCPTTDLNYQYDIIIWGSIYKYKGIIEFLKSKIKLNISFKILIIGKCNDADYDFEIQRFINKDVTYQNRFVDKTELDTLILSSRYVVFPYLKDSISSSGALIDSILLGKTVIGPNVGAFQELSLAGLCYTFDDYSDIFEIINRRDKVNTDLIEKFVNENVWDISAKKILSYI